MSQRSLIGRWAAGSLVGVLVALLCLPGVARAATITGTATVTINADCSGFVGWQFDGGYVPQTVYVQLGDPHDGIRQNQYSAPGAYSSVSISAQYYQGLNVAVYVVDGWAVDGFTWDPIKNPSGGCYPQSASKSASFTPSGGGGSTTTAPGPVGNVVVTPGNGQVEVSWTPPTTGGAPTGYRVDRNGTTVYDGPSTSYTDTGVPNGVPGSYTVTPYNGAGSGASSPTQTVTPNASAPEGTGPLVPGGSAYQGDGFCTATVEQDSGVGGDMSVNPQDMTWDGGLVTWTGVSGASRYEVWYQDLSGPGPARLAGVVQGAQTDGVGLSWPVGDRGLAGHRARYEVRAVSVDGSQLGCSGFIVVHSVYVALDKWSILKLSEAIAEALQGLLVMPDHGTGYAHVENSWNTIKNYGPFGEATKIGDAMKQFASGLDAGAKPSVSDIEAANFDFPLHLTDGSVAHLRMPLGEILALPGWSALWLVCTATLWCGFGIWVILRLSPKNQT